MNESNIGLTSQRRAEVDEKKVSEPQQEIENPAEKPVADLKTFRGRLLPIWIKICCWIFLVLSATGTLYWIVGAVSGVKIWLSLCGLTARGDALHHYLIMLLAIYLYAGALAWGLLWGRKWAPLAGIIWGFLAGIICIVTMVANQLNSIRLELIPLVFFTAKMVSIKYEWEIGPEDD